MSLCEDISINAGIFDSRYTYIFSDATAQERDGVREKRGEKSCKDKAGIDIGIC